MWLLLKAGLWSPFPNAFYQGMLIAQLCKDLISAGSHSCSDFEMAFTLSCPLCHASLNHFYSWGD